jgi:hypothetical protein
MAAPFGGHPKLAHYLAWAHDQQRCEVRSLVVVDQDGASYTAIRVKAPSGRHVIVVGIEQDEHLLPTQIAYFDRRLGLQSPWTSWDWDDS